jgi:hypothetical protein
MATGKSSPKLTANQIFNVIRGQELNFPFPVASGKFTVGTLDASTGKFAYAIGTYKETFGGLGGKSAPLRAKPVGGGGGEGPPKPKTLTGGRLDTLNVIDIVLRFKVKNRKGDFSATVDGAPALQTSTDTSVDVPIGAATILSFTLRSGGKTFTSELPLQVNRNLAGAGVFTLPALPVAVIYAPPVDQSQKNASKWSLTNTTGNTSTFSFSDSKSKTTPVTPEFDNVNNFVIGLKAYSKAIGELADIFKTYVLVSQVDIDSAKKVSDALGVIADALGSSDASETKGIAISTEKSVEITSTEQQTVNTNPVNGGPGSGDIVFYLKNVKLAWFVQTAGDLRVTVFEHGGIGTVSVGFLKSGGQTDLDADTAKAFLSLDPFVAGGPSAELPPARFTYLDTIDINGSEFSIVETHTVKSTEKKATTTTTTNAQTNKKGFLGFLGIGVTEDSTTQATITQSSARQHDDSHTVSNSIGLFANANERYVVEIYCDVVFGTFAYRQVVTSTTPLISGKAVPNQIITLLNNRKKFTTRSNSSGNYSFHASTIKPGNSLLESAGVKRTFQFTAPGMKQDLKP